MYAIYTYKAGSTSANILNDISSLITGAVTNKAALSTDCVQALTEIINIEPAGWSLYDGNAGVLSKVFRAPYSDDAASFKYLRIEINANTYIRLYSYEAWDNVLHTGTNVMSILDTTAYSQKINLTLGGRLDIRATERTFMIYSLQTGTWGNEDIGAAQAICERTRGNGWDTVAAGYPKWVGISGISGGSTNFRTYACRSINDAGADITGATVTYYTFSSPFGGVIRTAANWQTTGATFNPNASKQYSCPVHPLWVADPARGDMGGEISSLCGIYFTTTSLGRYDRITVENGDEYTCWTDGTYRFLIRRA